jgi:hypothetical protein
VADSLYYGFITATTVGYGDFHPTRTRSKYKAIFVALVGVLFTGIIFAAGIAAIEAAFVEVNHITKAAPARH